MVVPLVCPKAGPAPGGRHPPPLDTRRLAHANTETTRQACTERGRPLHTCRSNMELGQVRFSSRSSPWSKHYSQDVLSVATWASVCVPSSGSTDPPPRPIPQSAPRSPTALGRARAGLQLGDNHSCQSQVYSAVRWSLRALAVQPEPRCNR